MNEKKHRYKNRKRNMFSNQEDQLLMNLYNLVGDNWYEISRLMPGRNPRQCKERYMTYLNPKTRIGGWTQTEDELLIEKYQVFGSKWVKISKFFENRSDTSVKNRFQILKKTLTIEKKNQNKQKNVKDLKKKCPFDSIQDDIYCDLFSYEENKKNKDDWNLEKVN